MAATPRIGLEALPAQLAQELAPRVERLGYLGEFFQVAAHQPAALGHFVAFTEALKAALDRRVMEVVALTVAAGTRNEYERVQHERLALTIGFSLDDIAAIVGDDLDGPRFSDVERAAAALARDVVDARGRQCTSAFESLQDLGGPETAVACLMTATRYLAHATMANTWELRPPVPSPIAGERPAHV